MDLLHLDALGTVPTLENAGRCGFAVGGKIDQEGREQLPGGDERNSALNARDFFNFLDLDGDGEADQPSGKRTITGFAVGGPILKDKAFFFGGWEGTYQRLARTQTVTVATEEQRRGDFSAFLPGSPEDPNDVLDDTIIYDPSTGSEGRGRTPFPNNIVPIERISPSSLILQDLVPLPNLPGITANLERSGNEAIDRHNIDAKVDYYMTAGLRLWGKFSWMDAEVKKDPLFGNVVGGTGGDVGAGRALTDVKVYGGGHTWALTPTLLMDGNAQLLYGLAAFKACDE